MRWPRLGPSSAFSCLQTRTSRMRSQLLKGFAKPHTQQAHRRYRSAAATAAASAGRSCVQGAVEGAGGSSPDRGARPAWPGPFAGAAGRGSRACHRRDHRLQGARWLQRQLVCGAQLRSPIG